jgi:hypothetical protein
MNIKLFRVSCPYCTVGSAIVEVRKEHGAHIADTAPRQCELCAKYFDVQVKMELSGIPLDPLTLAVRDKSARRALKRIVGI